MNILKSYDFPVASRTDKGIVTESMIKDYFKKHKKDKPFIYEIHNVTPKDKLIFNVAWF
jgi:hypothetical protein